MWISTDFLMIYSIILLFDYIYVCMIIHELMQNQCLLTLALNKNKSIICWLFPGVTYSRNNYVLNLTF